MKGTPHSNSDPRAQDWGRWGPTLISTLAALLGALYLLAMRQPIGSQTDVLFVDPEVVTPEKMNQRLLDLLCANETNPATEEKLAVQRRNIAQSFQSRETTRFLERIGTYRSGSGKAKTVSASPYLMS